MSFSWQLFSLFSKSAFFQKLRTQKSSPKCKITNWEERTVFFHAQTKCSSIISSNKKCLPILNDDKVETSWKSFGAKNVQNQVFFFCFFCIFHQKRSKSARQSHFSFFFFDFESFLSHLQNSIPGVFWMLCAPVKKKSRPVA